MSHRYFIKSRKYLIFPILAFMLLAGMYMDQITILAHEETGSFSPSLYCRSQYSAHHDIRVTGIFDRETVLRKMEARRSAVSGRIGSRNGSFRQLWTPPMMSAFSTVSRRIAYECEATPLDTIIRYIHNQDGEKGSFLSDVKI